MALTVGAESIGSSSTRWEVGHQFTESTLDWTLIDLHVVGLVARVVDCRAVGDGQAGPVAGRVAAVTNARQFARSRNAFRFLSARVDELAEPAVVHFRSLDHVAGHAAKGGRFVVRNFRVGRQDSFVELERRVLDIRNRARNCIPNIFI